MFSKLAISAAKWTPALRSGIETRAAQQVFVRNASAAPAILDEPETVVVEDTPEVKIKTSKDRVAKWQAAHDLYNGPERDYVNFPMVKLRDQTCGFRLFFIPYPWFDAFYNYTGVTGPYILFGGTFLTMLSKEWLTVTDHAAILPCVVFMGYHYFHNTRAGNCKHPNPPGLKHSLKPSLEKLVESMHQAKTTAKLARQADVQEKQDYLLKVDDLVERSKSINYIYEIYKESVDLQLEEQYRKRLQDVHDSVKKRLDYQVAVDNAKRQFEQKHMIDYIVSNVRASITGQQEKEMLAKCFVDLKALAQKQAAA